MFRDPPQEFLEMTYLRNKKNRCNESFHKFNTDINGYFTFIIRQFVRSSFCKKKCNRLSDFKGTNREVSGRPLSFNNIIFSPRKQTDRCYQLDKQAYTVSIPSQSCLLIIFKLSVLKNIYRLKIISFSTLDSTEGGIQFLVIINEISHLFNYKKQALFHLKNAKMRQL